MRYVVTGDGLVIAGSEIGMAPIDETAVIEKGRLGPGQMLAIDLDRGRLLRDREIKDELAAELPYDEWTGKISELDSRVAGERETRRYRGPELRRRQIASAYSVEEMEAILHPMAEDAKEAI